MPAELSFKPFLTVEEQLALLEERGLNLGDRAVASRLILDTNYYRLSGYWRQFQVDPRAGRNDFKPGTTLAAVVQLMELDDRVRRLLLEALTSVEVAVRSRFAHEAGRVHGSGAFYLEPSSYLKITPDLDQHLRKVRSELMRPKLVTVGRYRRDDDLSGVPIWVAIELVTFGMLARMVQYFDDPAAAKETAHSLSLPWTGFQQTVHAFAVLRNLCAHHGQLWHRRSDVTAPVPRKDKRGEPRISDASHYAAIIALKRWMKALHPSSDWGARIDEAVGESADYREGICKPEPR